MTDINDPFSLEPLSYENSVVFRNKKDTFCELLLYSFAELIAFFFFFLSILYGGSPEKFMLGVWTTWMIFGNISGAHVNPVVTIAIWVNNGKLFSARNLQKLIIYLIFQIIGGFLAAVVYVSFNPVLPRPIFLLGDEVEPYQVSIVEGFFAGTFGFMALFISSGSTRPTEKNYVNVTLLAVWLFLCISSAGDISGGAINPTVYLLTNGIQYFYVGNKEAYKYYYAYIFPSLGFAIVFALVFKHIFRPFAISRKLQSQIISDY